MYLFLFDIVIYYVCKIIWYNLWLCLFFDWIVLFISWKVKGRIFFIFLEIWEFFVCVKWNIFFYGSIYFIYNYRLRIIFGVCVGFWNLFKISFYYYFVIYGIMLWWLCDINMKRNIWYDIGIWERKFSNSSYKKFIFIGIEEKC